MLLHHLLQLLLLAEENRVLAAPQAALHPIPWTGSSPSTHTNAQLGPLLLGPHLLLLLLCHCQH
jgi:hypothetical protein